MSTGSPSPIGANASVYQLDHQQLNNIIMPDLQDMANNLELLEQVRERRFNRDEPPPYRSPSPYSDDDDDNRPVLWPTSERDNIVAEINELVDQPLSEKELRETQRHFEWWHPAYHPGNRYETEATHAMFDLGNDPGLRDPKIREQLKGRAGEQRQKVFIRHGIKKRWERLGVWNPEWGIPGRVNEGSKDKPSTWKWRWQGDIRNRGADPDPYIPQHPNSRAIHLREGLRRGERGPLPPRHSLAPDASESVAESFITSRPWYILGLDEEEERTRLGRIPYNKQGFYNMNHKEHVAARWKERGDYIPYELWPRRKWKWQHESPSPEPEGLSSMDFTPSEIDALEAIPPPSPPAPRHFSADVIPKMNPMFAAAAKSIFGPSPRVTEPAPEAEVVEPLGELSDHVSPAPPLPPQQKPKRGRPQGRASTQMAKQTPGNAPNTSVSGPRRSARIAEIAQQVETAAAQTGSVTATRLRKGVPPKSNNPQAKSIAGAGSATPLPKRGRGRPPKSVPSKPQGVEKKRGRPRKAVLSEASNPEPVVKKRGRPRNTMLSEASKPQDIVKKRGRPRKTMLSETSKPLGIKKRGRPRKQ